MIEICSARKMDEALNEDACSFKNGKEGFNTC
jgi:hypothetical protein